MSNEEKPIKPPPGIDANATVARAAHYLGQPHNHEECQAYAEESLLGHGGVYDSAKQYYNWASGKNWIKTSAPPAGVPVFYAGNAKNGYGHVAISAGGGYVYSTDADGNKVGKVRYDKLWGGTGSGQYLGWTGAVQKTRGGAPVKINYDINTVGDAPEVSVPKPDPSPGPEPTTKVDTGKTKVDTGRTSITYDDYEEPTGVTLTSLQPNISKQFSKVTVGGNIPRLG